MRRVAPLLVLVVFSPALRSQFSGSYPLLDGDVIRYQSTPPNDPVARLKRRIDEGSEKLQFQPTYGYLISVLEHLKIPLSSQALVFSKTSTQQALISPATPRALYFNDSVYVGFVHGGEFLELAAVDPAQGTMFYTLEQRPSHQPKFTRRQECLQCHAAPNTLGVPGLLMRSVYTAPDGVPELHVEPFVTTQSSPLKERWGGWYVTGTHGAQRHMGNIFIRDHEHPDRLDLDAGANVTSLRGRFDVTAYPTANSDVIALMILAHQTRMHDLITRVNWESRLALHGATDLERIHRAVEILLRAMLFTDEIRLESRLQGTSRFASDFAAAGPQDRSGRSLRDLDMNHRMFRYPCSFLIYSDAFNALPKPALDYFYQRLWEVLTEKDTDAAFANLTATDRKAILSILRDTKADLPAYWHGPAQ